MRSTRYVTDGYCNNGIRSLQVEEVNMPKVKAALKAESNFVAGGSVLKIEVEV